MLTDLWSGMQTGNFTQDATWLTIYLLVPLALATGIFMIKIGPRLLLDWAYTWFMLAFGIWVARIIYIVKIDPQPLATSNWTLILVLNVLASMTFAFGTLVVSGYQLFHARHHPRTWNGENRRQWDRRAEDRERKQQVGNGSPS